MRCTVTQLARESVELCPLSSFVREGIRVITQLTSKQNYKNNSCTQFAREDVGLSPFYNSNVKKRQNNCFTTKFSQTILRNHLGFIITSAIKYVSCNVKVDNLTFINICETVFNSDNLFRHVLKAIAS